MRIETHGVGIEHAWAIEPEAVNAQRPTTGAVPSGLPWSITHLQRSTPPVCVQGLQVRVQPMPVGYRAGVTIGKGFRSNHLGTVGADPALCAVYKTAGGEVCDAHIADSSSSSILVAAHTRILVSFRE